MNDSPIEEYLDVLFAQLRSARARDARSLLAETETHLRHTADEVERTGLTARDAELVAVERFGDAKVLARDDRARHRAGLLISISVSTWALGALGAVAVGISGVVAGLMRLAGTSNQFIAGNPSTSTLKPGACARWLTNYPHADLLPPSRHRRLGLGYGRLPDRVRRTRPSRARRGDLRPQAFDHSSLGVLAANRGRYHRNRCLRRGWRLASRNGDRRRHRSIWPRCWPMAQRGARRSRREHLFWCPPRQTHLQFSVGCMTARVGVARSKRSSWAALSAIHILAICGHCTGKKQSTREVQSSVPVFKCAAS